MSRQIICDWWIEVFFFFIKVGEHSEKVCMLSE